MRSLADDRTARARIRDEALRLFASQGPDAVTIRAVAAAAGVSPALIMRHYQTKDGLRAAVDEHVVTVFETMLAEVVHPDGGGPFGAEALPTMAAQVVTQLPADSPIPAYIGRMLLAGDPAGSALFARLHAVSRAALSELAGAGLADPGADPTVRAAFLLVNDLAVLILRPHISTVLGVELFTEAGMQRWGAEVLSIYRTGLGGTVTDRNP
ncbi:TetR/AcrR family transcriptional regulator [Nocardia sp. NPDC003345]